MRRHEQGFVGDEPVSLSSVGPREMLQDGLGSAYRGRNGSFWALETGRGCAAQTGGELRMKEPHEQGLASRLGERVMRTFTPEPRCPLPNEAP